MLEEYGLHYQRPQETHMLPGRVFSALQLICIMCADFERIGPGMDIRVELGDEWEMAEGLGFNEGNLSYLNPNLHSPRIQIQISQK